MRRIAIIALTALAAVIFSACPAAPVDVKSASNFDAANTSAARPAAWTAAIYTKKGETWMPAFGMGL